MKHSSISVQGLDNLVESNPIVGRINIEKVPHDDSILTLVNRDGLAPTAKRLFKRLNYLKKNNGSFEQIEDAQKRFDLVKAIAEDRQEHGLIQELAVA